MGEKIIGVKYKNSPGDQTTFEIVSVTDDGIDGKSNLTNEIFSVPDGRAPYHFGVLKSSILLTITI